MLSPKHCSGSEKRMCTTSPSTADMSKTGSALGFFVLLCATGGFDAARAGFAVAPAAVISWVAMIFYFPPNAIAQTLQRERKENVYNESEHCRHEQNRKRTWLLCLVMCDRGLRRCTSRFRGSAGGSHFLGCHDLLFSTECYRPNTAAGAKRECVQRVRALPT